MDSCGVRLGVGAYLGEPLDEELLGFVELVEELDALELGRVREPTGSFLSSFWFLFFLPPCI
jgi:hypothetical protein